ncbi:uncharacterized protein LOC117896294 [Drosophila subobscura]|uniref:uncharacterized protein LOC117896294 n=1 Tax=Drosophila subobscura TaxID=7241 RepID=UPI00155A4ED8|nr:uncharacterized protein LOC117896294 [Drosophila subobscura]
MSVPVTAHCSWTQTAGSELSKLVPTQLSDDDVFVKPDLDDVVNESRAVLFSHNDDPPPPCELRFQIIPRFKIAALTLVCSAPKVELFIGPLQEYCETIYGTCLEEEDEDVPIRPYRYDMEIDRSGIADINLKLLTAANEICVYGAILHVAPNPNGITTQLPRPVDLQKVKELLQTGATGDGKTKAEEHGDKLQKFMSLMKSCTVPAETPSAAKVEDVPPELMSLIKGCTTHAESPAQAVASDLPDLQDHIDKKFEQLEQLVTTRLEAFEARQTEKLNQIISLLLVKN